MDASIEPARATRVDDTPNAEHIGVWERILVPKSTRFRRVLVDAGLAHTELALAAHPVHEGARVLDVGCGFGETSIELARRVGAGGRVVGVDCCSSFLDVARADAACMGLHNVAFARGDAQVDRFGGGFDLCFSQFGTMFFANPVVAMKTLRGQLRPGGRLLMQTWAPLEDNPWLGLAKGVVASILPPVPPKAETCGPGPFSMADAGVVRAILEAAGFDRVQLTRNERRVWIGADVDDAIEFQLALGPAGELVRQAGDEAERLRPRLVEALRVRLSGYAEADGVFLPSASWCAAARSGD